MTASETDVEKSHEKSHSELHLPSDKPKDDNLRSNYRPESNGVALAPWCLASRLMTGNKANSGREDTKPPMKTLFEE